MMASNDEHTAAPVIALHCSGSGANQWRQLGETLDARNALNALNTDHARYTLMAPEHYGCDSVGPWSGERAFTLADEAARCISSDIRMAVALRCARPLSGPTASRASRFTSLRRFIC
jgi:hypothetical protein